MTKDQALQLGRALLAWSKGFPLEARDTLNPNGDWIPFCPGNYEKLNVDEGLEWRMAARTTSNFSASNRFEHEQATQKRQS